MRCSGGPVRPELPVLSLARFGTRYRMREWERERSSEQGRIRALGKGHFRKSWRSSAVAWQGNKGCGRRRRDGNRSALVVNRV
jgi:hypothetical protein